MGMYALQGWGQSQAHDFDAKISHDNDKPKLRLVIKTAMLGLMPTPAAQNGSKPKLKQQRTQVLEGWPGLAGYH